jgi:hypothetical protein
MMQIPFHWTRDSLEAEERRLRLAAEARAQALATLLEELAMRLAPKLVEARRRQDPACFLHMDGAGWRQFWQAVEVKAGPPPPAVQPSLLPDAAELQAALRAADAENERLRSELEGLQAVDTVEPPDPTATQEMAHLPSIDFALPEQPPAALAGWFANWPRDGMALSVLAQTGWSLRHAIAQAMAARLGITATAGSLKRLFGHLHRNGLWQMETVAVGQMSVSLVQLTEKGREAAAHLGITAVSSEWERLHSEHGGSAQIEHTALVCMFTHQARQRNHVTEVCPAAAGPSAPDALLRQGDSRVYVEVEAESGDAERRMRKWRNLADLQGFVALCALTPESARRLVLEARGASLHGRATDIDTLFRQPGLWAIEW